MSERVFVDTGVLLSAHDLDAGVQHAIAEQVVRQLWDERLGVSSTQVLQEFYVAVTERIATPISRRDARDLLAAYQAWPIVSIEAADVLVASDLQDRFKLTFWNALLVSGAIKARATMILSQELQPYRQIAGIEVRNPFA